MGTGTLLPVLMEVNPTLVLMEVLPQKEDPVVEDPVEDVPRKTKYVVMDPPQSLMETRALPLVLMEASQSVQQMIVNMVLLFAKA